MQQTVFQDRTSLLRQNRSKQKVILVDGFTHFSGSYHKWSVGSSLWCTWVSLVMCAVRMSCFFIPAIAHPYACLRLLLTPSLVSLVGVSEFTLRLLCCGLIFLWLYGSGLRWRSQRFELEGIFVVFQKETAHCFLSSEWALKRKLIRIHDHNSNLIVVYLFL